MNSPRPADRDSSDKLLREINALAAQLQKLRLSRGNPDSIRRADEALRSKWAELRSNRAGNIDAPRRGTGSHWS